MQTINQINQCSDNNINIVIRRYFLQINKNDMKV